VNVSAEVPLPLVYVAIALPAALLPFELSTNSGVPPVVSTVTALLKVIVIGIVVPAPYVPAGVVELTEATVADAE
jgi:hypothetical protein